MKVPTIVAILVTATGYAVAVPFNHTRIGVAVAHDNMLSPVAVNQEVIPSTNINKRHTANVKGTVKADVVTADVVPIVKRFEAPAITNNSTPTAKRFGTPVAAARNFSYDDVVDAYVEKLKAGADRAGKYLDEVSEQRKAARKANGTSTHDHKGQ